MTRLDLDDEIVVGIAIETFETVRRDFLLPVHIGDGCFVIVRMKLLLSLDVREADHEVIVDEAERSIFAWVAAVFGRRVIEYEPVVVVISMRVEGDLLLCAGVSHQSERGGNKRHARFEPVG